ncbi:hypothetical protein FDH01_gp207 [Acinetobacter phage vB_AbaM_ME3]|uniref:Putative membrane protein n=1 Tax=Acinetobacter phage vB_AbaM_ME3 TaxID=1837876 RepID=A0A172Q0Q0_9CAUD|nr:hypothetical protein FDH01_gp207 [Acinetobacter phage vB_AbaM_ME3]AND75415.1 putative membrane protein [Acinetobacter phage vB_AbaM_ME3]
MDNLVVWSSIGLLVYILVVVLSSILIKPVKILRNTLSIWLILFIMYLISLHWFKPWMV